MFRKPSSLALGFSLLLAACTSPISTSKTQIQIAEANERLGTQWGDEIHSAVTKVDLRRVSNTAISQNTLYYANKDYRGRSVQSISLASGKIAFSVKSDTKFLPLIRENSNYYLQGKAGTAYHLVYKNNSNKTYEIVASVDGLDVINGKPASRGNSGYVLSPYSQLVIEGFRKSQTAVASFIFTTPEDSYANHISEPNTRNTGIIGTVVYELYTPSTKRPLSPKLSNSPPQAFPADNNYAQPPQ